MKKIIHTVLAVLVITSMTGCASTYMVDRRRDALDVFTIAGGVGLGARARIGPIHGGLILYGGDVGLYAGDIVECYAGSCIHFVDTEIIGFGVEQMGVRLFPSSTRTDRLDGKYFFAESSTVPFVATKFNSNLRFPHPYWTQCEVQLGIIPAIRLGFNPGELFDFLLGWVGIDIYDDDFSPIRCDQRARVLQEKRDRIKKERQAQLAKVPEVIITEEQVLKQVRKLGVPMVRKSVPLLATTLALPDYLIFNTENTCYTFFSKKGEPNDITGLFISQIKNYQLVSESEEIQDILWFTRYEDIQVKTRKGGGWGEGKAYKKVRDHFAAIRHGDGWLQFSLRTWEDEPVLGPEILIAIMKSFESK